MPELRARKSAAAACVLAGLLFLLTACDGIGEADDDSAQRYLGGSFPSSSSGSSGGHSFDDIMRFSNSGDTDTLVKLFRDGTDDSGSSPFSMDSADGMDTVVLDPDDIRLPSGGKVVLTITGGDVTYSKEAAIADDGLVYFSVPKIAVGAEITVCIDVKRADGGIIRSGRKFRVVRAKDSQFDIVLVSAPEGFVLVKGNGSTVGDLYVCDHEVTQGEYEVYCSYQDSSTTPSVTYGAGPNYPVYYVNWYDALVYCNLRSIAENLTPCYSIGGSTNPADWGAIPSSNNATWNDAICNFTANGYRLPTEVEWEYAARGGLAQNGYTYAGSNVIDDVAWYTDNSDKTCEIKKKKANSAGLYDITGNVWERCWDKYSDSSFNRVGRGGSWYSSAIRCVLSDRAEYYPYGRNNGIGFRVVRNAD